MKYLIYARVSPRGDQTKETSISMQIEMCREYIATHGGTVHAVLSDEFYSGKDMHRPAFKQLMAELDTGTAEWDTICVYKLSRMTRSLRDGANIFDTLCSHNKGFVSITERNLDFSTPSGRAMLGILQVFNQFEREQIAENTRNKMISIAKQGLWPTGKSPFGYRRGDKGDNKLYIDPRKAEIVRDVFAMYLDEEFTSMAIIKKYRQYIGSRQRLMNILRNRTVLGLINYAGQLYPGQHDPIITEELFNQVQTIIPQAKRPTQSGCRHTYLLSGLVRCHCGRYMTPASAKSGVYHYYQCTDIVTCKNRVSAPKIEKEAVKHLSRMKIKPAVLTAAIKKIEELQKEYSAAMRPELDSAIIAKREAETEKKKLYKTLITGKLTDAALEFFNETFKKLENEVTNLTARIDYLQSQCVDDDQIKKDALRIVDQMKYLSDALKLSPKDPNLIKPLLSANIKQVNAQKDGKFKFEFTWSSPSRKEWGG
jgi:site-specific DNA recombinase